jgi:hypothetical protein
MSLFFNPNEVASYMKGIPDEAIKNRNVFLDDKAIFSASNEEISEQRNNFNNSIGFPPVTREAFVSHTVNNKVFLFFMNKKQ